jgi:multidrug efflux pump subunit AcrA (membrane-fusion protein)
MIEALANALRRHRISSTVVLLTAVALIFAGATLWRQDGVDAAMTAVVRKGTLTAQLTASGILKPVQSITYRSPLPRDAEVTFLVDEGARVNEGDLLARIDTTDVQRELERATQEGRQAQVDLQVAEIDRQEGQTAVDSLAEGEGAISVDETRTRLQLAERKVARLQEEQRTLQPLLEKGFITREELRKTSDDLEQAEQDMALARRRAEVLIEQTHPRDRQRAALQLAQKNAQRENVRARVQEAEAHIKLLKDQLENSSIYARRPGLVVYEEYLGANPRRKIRVGDRVTSSQGLVTIPEVTRMLVEASVSEADVHRVLVGQSATVLLEAFPGLRLAGHVTRVGTLARSSAERPLDDKRFDLIVELDSSPAELRPEMTARVDVLLGERRDVLLLPVNAVFERQGQRVCHVLGPNGTEAVAVQLGESNDLFVEVTSGVREGDRVALTDVASSTPPASAGATGRVVNPAVSGKFQSTGGSLNPR